MGRAGRWLVAGLVVLAAFGVATWVSGAFALTRLLPSADIRWPVAFGIGAAAAGFAGLWGQSWATQTGDQAAGGAAASNVGADRSVTVGGDNPGIIATGDSPVIVQAAVLPPEVDTPPAQIDAPPGLANLPERPGLFVGRAADLARLEAAMTATGTDVVVQAVHGLGGIGKSTLAAHYAAIHRQDFDVMWWVAAGSPAGIDSGLAALATALQPGLVGLLPIEALRERAVAWLASH